MIEFWASVGLAYFNSDFYEEVIDQRDLGRAGEAIASWGIRLSRFEFAELRRLLKDPDLIECIRKSQRRMTLLKCPPPPKPCPYKASDLDAWYEQFKAFVKKEGL